MTFLEHILSQRFDISCIRRLYQRSKAKGHSGSAETRFYIEVNDKIFLRYATK